MLTSARNEYAEQVKITDAAVRHAQRLARRGSILVAQSVQTYQAEAVALSLSTLGAMLAEQGIEQAAEAAVSPVSLLTPVRDLSGMLVSTDTPAELARMVATMVRDASRTARAVDQATRPAVTGYVRSLSPPSCGRCAVLAGRVYRYSQGFLRHPKCDCLMTPTTLAAGRDLVTDPMTLFEKGQIRGLSGADVEAVNRGADLAQVVNVRRKAAGLTEGSSVMIRAGRLTPQACLSRGTDRAEQLSLLRQFGYIA